MQKILLFCIIGMGCLISGWLSDSDAIKASHINIMKENDMNKKEITGIQITGNNHPAHPWQETSEAIKEIYEPVSEITLETIYNPDSIINYNLEDVDFILMNYCNWKDADGLSDQAKRHFIEAGNRGVGFIIVHLANGAFHYSLPGAGGSDWPEYRQIVARVWDHNSNSAHDPYQKIEVHVTSDHPLNNGLSDFIIKDELYFNQKGTKTIDTLLTAFSKETNKEEPIAWHYTYKNSKVYQTLLGHDRASFDAEGFRLSLINAAFWVSGVKP
jgi:type 1 glutamine amidotransferase